jgi:hypothetical protein
MSAGGRNFRLLPEELQETAGLSPACGKHMLKPNAHEYVNEELLRQEKRPIWQTWQKLKRNKGREGNIPL